MLRFRPPNLVAVALLMATSSAAQAAGRTIHSFVDDRARAHRSVDGHRVLAAGKPQVNAFRTPRTRGLDYTVPTPTLYAVHVALRPTGGRMRVRATIDGKVNVPFLKIRTRDARVITGRLKTPLPAGEHRIRLKVRGADIDWIALGPAEPPPTLSAGAPLPPLLSPSGKALVVPAGGDVTFHTLPPKGAHLQLTAVARGTGSQTLTVFGRTGKRERELTTKPIGAGTSVDVSVDLSRHAGQVMALRFAVEGSPGSSTHLVGARLSLPKATPSRRGLTRKVDNVLFWLVDTLRADHVHAYNRKSRVKTPNLDRLAREGVLFEACLAQGNESLSSHATLFSGQYPVTHKLTTPKRRLPKRLTTMTEALNQARFRTGGFIANGYMSDRWGFGEGWDAYVNFIRESKPSRAAVVWKHGRKFLEKKVDGHRFFTYLGTIDPHVAYNAPEPFRTMYVAGKYSGRLRPQATGVFLDKWKANGKKPTLTRADKQFMVDLYDGEISYNDSVLGEALDYLDEKGLTDNTLVVIASDHGEEFFEHGNAGHGHTTRQVLTHVPLIMRWTGALPAGRRVEEDVELTDVMPTVLDLAGVKVPRTVQGESLVSLMMDSQPAMPRPAFSFHGGVRALKLGRWKYLLLSRGERLYDLREDPDEHTNVTADNPLTTRYLREVMALHFRTNQSWKKSVHGHPSSPTAAGAALLLSK